MWLDFKHLKQLNVETESGQLLGKVYGLVLELGEQFVVQYKVGSILRTKKYLVSRDQVIRFEEKRMVVVDNIAREVGIKKNRRAPVQTRAEPVVMRSK